MSFRNGWTILIVALIAIGLGDQLLDNPFSILFPLAIGGIIYYLYKFPPRWLLRLTSHRPPTPRKKEAKPKKRRFRVIDGNKKKTL